MTAKLKAQDLLKISRTGGVLLALVLFSPHPAARPAGPAQIPDLLDPLQRSYSKPVESAIEALKRGASLLSEGRYGKALEALTPAQPADGFLIEDYALHYRAAAWLKAGQPREAARCYRLARERRPDSRLRKDSILGECEALVASGDPGAALTLLESSGLPSDSGTLYMRALAEEAAGNRKTAREIYLRVYTDLVNAPEAALAGSRLSTLAPGFTAKPEHLGLLLQRAENLLRAGRIADARSLLLLLSSLKAPDASVRQRRKVLLADAERRQGRHRRALELLRGAAAIDPETHARALYLQAACNRALKREGAFAEARNLATRLYPESHWTEMILYSTATYYDVENRTEMMREAYAALLAGFPRGEHAERASWRIAVLTYAGGQYEEAARRFARHLQSYRAPGAAPAAAYWLGRCCEKLDDPRTAARLYRNAAALANHSYYGWMAQQAADVLPPEGRGIRPVVPGADLPQALSVLEGIRVRPATIAAPAGPAALAIERARQLASAELLEEALAELRAAAERYPEEKAVPYVAARIHERQGDFRSVIAVLHRAFPDYSYLPPASLPRELREMLFPVPYHDLVRVHAATEELDPSLVFGLIRQESAFKESAQSRANARGLMQIVPSTGRRLARQAGLRGYSTAKLYQAGTNIALGTRHLASLLQMFGGRMELALAAYNAGEQRAQRWKTQFGDTDMALFVEQVPFMETRHYIRQVLTNREHYRAILKE